MAIDPFANCNWAIDDDQCTLQTCCLAPSSSLYIPNLGGNVFFTVWFALLMIPHIGLGVYYKTWGVFGGHVSGACPGGNRLWRANMETQLPLQLWRILDVSVYILMAVSHVPS